MARRLLALERRTPISATALSHEVTAMSYDVLIHAAGGSGADASWDPAAPPLGTRTQVARILESSFPGLKWDEPTFAAHETGAGSAEFNLAGEDDPIRSFMVHLHGDFSLILRDLEQMAGAQGWEVFDCQDDDEDGEEGDAGEAEDDEPAE
jgi:hypothetical protein